MTVPRPYALLAEITYRCPLHCPYCSNPVAASLCEAPRRPPSFGEPSAGRQGSGYSNGELTTEEWKRVISEAAALGVLQIGFSGGEPLARSVRQSFTRTSLPAASAWMTIAWVRCAMLD
jgi:pyrroloquinoline quinone biosynthesis protein E